MPFCNALSTAWLVRARVAKHDVARLVLLGLLEIQPQAFPHTAQQRPAASEDDRADDELILVDQTVLRELRHDGAATKDDQSLPGWLFMVSISRGSSQRRGTSLISIK